jgi:methylaspartate mutase sigma subunit
VIIGTANGHAFEDLRPLREAKDTLSIVCPVILGGKHWVGPNRPADLEHRLRGLGVDYILERPRDLLAILEALPRRNTVGSDTISAELHRSEPRLVSSNMERSS